jgi:DNA polymerase-3 subunit chi
MTEVAFHFNLPDKLTYACRFLRKAVGSGARVLVVAGPDNEALLHQLDQALWTFSAQEFLPHCTAQAAPAVLTASPLLLADSVATTMQPQVAAHWPQADVLLNLGEGVPPGFESFLRLIELVSLDDADRQAARARWKHYQERGYPLVRHDIAAKA